MEWDEWLATPQGNRHRVWVRAADPLHKPAVVSLLSLPLPWGEGHNNMANHQGLSQGAHGAVLGRGRRAFTIRSVTIK